jgi:hypothetical protein
MKLCVLLLSFTNRRGGEDETMTLGLHRRLMSDWREVDLTKLNARTNFTWSLMAPTESALAKPLSLSVSVMIRGRFVYENLCSGGDTG